MVEPGGRAGLEFKGLPKLNRMVWLLGENNNCGLIINHSVKG